MIHTWLHQQSEVNGSGQALSWGDRSWSFRELADDADALAGSWADIFQAGERIGFYLKDDPKLVVCLWAAFRLGAVAVPLHRRLTAFEVLHQMAEAGVNGLITDRDISKELPSLEQTGIPVYEIDDLDVDVPSSRLSKGYPSQSHNLITVLFTSGRSTGRPKGVCLTAENLASSAQAWNAFLRIGPDDRYLCALPLAHVAGLGILIRSALAGFAVELLSNFDAAHVSHLIDEGKISHASLVPTQLKRIMDQHRNSPFPSSLKALAVGGGPLPDAVFERASVLRAPLVITYGMTETASGVTAMTMEEAKKHPGSSGRPLSHSHLEVVDDAGQPLAPQEMGFLRIAGPAVMAGYLEGPETDGTFLTGDRGRLDEDGFLYLETPGEDMIITGGENVDPVEVENILLQMPVIEQVCVVGLPDADLGQRVAAALVIACGKDIAKEEIMAFCRGRLAGYKIPRRTVCLPSLPMTVSGKVSRHKVRQILAVRD